MNLRVTSILVTTLVVAILLIACKDDGDSNLFGQGGIFFEIDKANAAAHAAMVQPADLPGSGWEVVGTDETDDDDGGGDDFMAMASREPACSQLTSLASLEGLGGIFGNDDGDDTPAGWAQIELQRQNPSPTAFLPVSIESEVEIARTAAEVQASWQIVKNLLESDQTKNCMSRVINSQFTTEMAASGLRLSFEPRNSSVRAPHDGASLSFAMSISLPGIISADAILEMHLWPYGNGQISVFLIGPKDEMTPALVGDLLKAVDNKVAAAEKAN